MLYNMVGSGQPAGFTDAIPQDPNINRFRL
jgi:hypothetical protein